MEDPAMPRRYISALRTSTRVLFRGFSLISVAGFSVLLALLFTNVVSRNIAGNSFAWIDEVSKFIFTWIMFLGIAMCIYKKRLIGMEFFTSKLPKNINSLLKFVSTIVFIAFFFILTLYGTKYSIATSEMFSPVLNISYGVVYLCIPVCGVSSIFFCVADLFGSDPSEMA